MKRLLLCLLTALLGLLASDYPEAGQTVVVNGMADTGRVTAVRTDTSPDQQAIISESPSLPNLISTRTQRILPSQSAKNHRTMRCCATPSFKHRKTLSNSFDKRRGRLAAPFQSRVSSDYFIIALRRIVR